MYVEYELYLTLISYDRFKVKAGWTSFHTTGTKKHSMWYENV